MLMLPQPQTIQQQLLRLAVLVSASNKPDSISSKELIEEACTALQDNDTLEGHLSLQLGIGGIPQFLRTESFPVFLWSLEEKLKGSLKSVLLAYAR
jgi:hypothetical protein